MRAFPRRRTAGSIAGEARSAARKDPGRVGACAGRTLGSPGLRGQPPCRRYKRQQIVPVEQSRLLPGRERWLSCAFSTAGGRSAEIVTFALKSGDILPADEDSDNANLPGFSERQEFFAAAPKVGRSHPAG